jgi:hypothetical protein
VYAKNIKKTLLLQNCATLEKVCKKTSETSTGQSLLGGISIWQALGADFNFCTNRNAGFGLNILANF